MFVGHLAVALAAKRAAPALNLGWTMAAGSGRVIADLISGRTPEVDVSGLTLARYGF